MWFCFACLVCAWMLCCVSPFIRTASHADSIKSRGQETDRKRDWSQTQSVLGALHSHLGHEKGSLSMSAKLFFFLGIQICPYRTLVDFAGYLSSTWLFILQLTLYFFPLCLKIWTISLLSTSSYMKINVFLFSSANDDGMMQKEEKKKSKSRTVASTAFEVFTDWIINWWLISQWSV